MDIGSRLLVVKAAPGDAERELTKASRGDRRNDVVNRDESSEITMNLRTSISSKELLHLLTELIYFVLYMHQQMPCTYEELKNCCKEQTEAVVARSSGAGDSSNPALRGRQRREEASNLRKLVKLKDQIEKVVRALKSSLTSLSDIRSVLVILGPSPMRPKHVYEVHLRCQVNDVGDDTVEDRPKSSDLARKLIRALISDGATSSAESSMKLFLVIGASANPISVPEDVHPKRGLVISRKQGSRTSVRLVQQRETNLEAEVSSICLSDPSPSTSDDDDSNESLCDNDYMWYVFFLHNITSPQTRHSSLDLPSTRGKNGANKFNTFLILTKFIHSDRLSSLHTGTNACTQSRACSRVTWRRRLEGKNSILHTAAVQFHTTCTRVCTTLTVCLKSQTGRGKLKLPHRGVHGVQGLF